MTNPENSSCLRSRVRLPAQLEQLLGLAEAKGVSLAELIEEALEQWLTKEFDGPSNRRRVTDTLTSFGR